MIVLAFYLYSHLHVWPLKRAIYYYGSQAAVIVFFLFVFVFAQLVIKKEPLSTMAAER